MASTVLIDAGSLVALIRKKDVHHEWAKAQGASLPFPWSTCEAVISEAFHLLDGMDGRILREYIRRGALSSRFDFQPHAKAIVGLMEKYADIPMSFADACLVRMTEIDPGLVVFTTDSDFKIYRRNGRQVIPLIAPF